MPQPATPTTPLDVPATPTSAVPNSATGKDNQVLATGATAPGKRQGFGILITTDEFKAVGTALYQQTQGSAPSEVRTVKSADDLRVVLAEYSSIEHVSLFIHMVDDELLFDTQQLTLAQTQKVLDGSVPPITRWSFDGCSIGRGSEALYAFTAHFGIKEVDGWTHFHLIEQWGKSAWGTPSAADIAAIHTEVERAANFLPKGDAGATYTSSEIEATLLQGTTVQLIAEVFTFDFDHSRKFADVLNDPRWIDSITGQPVSQPWNAVRDPRDAWYPRAAAKEWRITSQQQATAFEQYFDSNPVLYRVVIVPTVKGP